MIGTNCYLVINEETKDTVMVDPGAYPTKLKNAVKEQGLKACNLKLLSVSDRNRIRELISSAHITRRQIAFTVHHHR